MSIIVHIVIFIAKAIFWIAKLALKILFLPLVIGLTLLEWLCMIAVGFFGPLCNLLGTVAIATGFLSYGFGLNPVSEMWRIVGSGVAFCLIPLIASWIITRIVILNATLSSWLRT